MRAATAQSESLSALLERLDACRDARSWAANYTDLATAWGECKRADWMLWLASRVLPRQIVVQAACDCAETALEYVGSGETQTAILLTLHIAREWAEGREDIETVRAASSCAAARSAADAAYAAYAAYAAADAARSPARSAADAAYAAYAASAAADAARAAARSAAADAAWDAAWVAAYAARSRALAGMADLVRARISAEQICSSVMP